MAFHVLLLSICVSLLSIQLPVVDAFNNPPGVEIWCGKAYRPENASFSPGGWLNDPTPSAGTLLDFTIRPRMNIYLASETTGTFIVDALLGNLVGVPFESTSPDGNPVDFLVLDVTLEGSDVSLVDAQIIGLNSSDNEFPFSLASLTPQLEPYNISAIASTQDRSNFYAASTQVYRLPDRTDGGSTVKVDSLYGGLMVPTQTTASGNSSSATSEWSPLFPYSYYVSWSGYLNESITQLDAFKAQGYNIIHVVPADSTAGDDPFPWDQFDQYLSHADSIGLWVMYDMRWTYQNVTSVTDQVNNHVLKHPSLLLYYTGDEPDGSGDPLNATAKTYSLLKSLDPYHPVSLCLNCFNFYYKEYSSGADIVMADPYPISVDTTYSTVYDTVCNTTYGCCGCDDCNGDFADISTRFDTLNHYDDILSQPRKPKWAVPQAFGNNTFWHRNPTAAEEVVMDMLAINHGVKGLVAWDYPTTPEIGNVTQKLAPVLTSAQVTGFLLNSTLHQGLGVSGASGVDAAAWMSADGTVLLSVVSTNYQAINGTVQISLPASVGNRQTVLWGPGAWTVSENGTVSTNGLEALEVDLVVFS